MTEHLKVYLEGSGFQVEEWIPCEVCEQSAVDIHHIESRGMGGTKKKDVFPNLMALCRKCHDEYGDITELKEKLTEIHLLKFKK